MIIRAPTRTLTKSFHGKQMEFKFPSVGNLRRENNIPKNLEKPILNDEDVHSYCTVGSNTNTNSSIGHYSFANISDNTTSLINKGNSHQSSPTSSESAEFLNTSEFIIPKDEHCNQSSQKSRRPMEAIPEDHCFGSVMSNNMNYVPTADNFSFDIASSNSLGPTDIAKNPGVATLTRSSSNSSGFFISSSSSSRTKRKSQLKRSPALRCKGGFLKYFQLLASRIRRTLRKIKLAFRSKRRRRQASYASMSSPSSVDDHMDQHRFHLRRSSSKKEFTSHLKRTNGYVSNLQRSISRKSLRPPLEAKSDNTSSSTIDLSRPHSDVRGIGLDRFVTVPDSRIVRNPTASLSLRRTSSSIRRAASVIRNQMPVNNGVLSESPVHEDIRSVSRINAANRLRLMKSNHSRSLNSSSRKLSLARQRSIVVKNKVIPLSMHQYSIKEEDEDKERENQYFIKSSSVYSLAPISSISSRERETHSRSECEKSASYYTDAKENPELESSTTAMSSDEVSYSKSIVPSPELNIMQGTKSKLAGTYEEDDWDDIEEDSGSPSVDDTDDTWNDVEEDASFDGSEEIEEFVNNINHYFRCVVARRIKMQLQFRHHGSSLESFSSSYLGMIESLLSDYGSEASNVKISESDNTTQWSSNKSGTDSIRVNLESPYVDRISTQRSLISLKSRDVQKSFTLPIGIKV